MSITVTLIGPDQVWSIVTISQDATVRDIATSEHHLFWRMVRRDGTTVPFTASVSDGDIVTVETNGVDGR